MATVVKVDGHTCWLDSNERKVPVEYVPKEDRTREALIDDVFNRIVHLHEQMSEVKRRVTVSIREYLDSVAESYGEDWQGAATLSDFGGQRKVEVKIKKFLGFDERIQLAKQKIDQCLESWSEGARRELTTLVKAAFQSDSQGKLNAHNILSLLKYEIDDPVWQDAMGLIKSSMKVERAKDYYRFMMRDDDGNWETVQLNFAAMEVNDGAV